ncbi:acyltransferase family protein [Microvirga alba]|uniref:Acyltransferase n=1 Tax=Microvirga alba TaxID=2791025 RepID=A0A931BMT9_9HYPH|nr:acyltransferase [Microvirga alba]MBF9232813.1 acyltransferase [Microvirga alba]
MTPLSSRMALKHFKGPGFDRIRVVAALVVVVHHCTTYITPNISHDILFHFSRGSIQFGILAVNVFFAVSGFLVVPGLIRKRDITAFAVHRFLRIMPALFINILLTIFLVGPLLSNLPLTEYFRDAETYRYLNNLIFRMTSTLPGVQFDNGSAPVINGSLWTLYFEMLSYVVLVLMFFVGALSNRIVFMILFSVVYLSNILLWFRPELSEAMPSRIVVFNSLFVYFFSGVMLNIFADKVPYDKRIAIFILMMCIILLPLGLGPVILPLSVAYLVVYIGFSDVFGSRQFRSDYSYGIYLNHAVVLTILLILVPQLKSFFAALIFVTLAAILIAFLSWRFIEAPSLRLKEWSTDRVRKKLEHMVKLLERMAGYGKAPRL